MLRFRNQDLQTAAIHFDIASGFSEPASVRGEDDIVPAADGRYVGPRRKDQRRIVLTGWVRGIGADWAERATAFREATDTLMGVMDLSDDPGTLETGSEAPGAFPDDPAAYLGLSSDYELEARPVNLVGGPLDAHMSYQTWSIELVCVDSPPEWIEIES
jgi:hypothetical protein